MEKNNTPDTSTIKVEEVKTKEKKKRIKKAESPEHIAKRHARESKELLRREKTYKKPVKNYYIWYLFFVLCLAYIIDEAASGIGGQFQTSIVEAFFQQPGETYAQGLTRMTSYAVIGVAFNLLILVYKPLSDRFGRKPFLFINTLFMAIGLFIVYMSTSLWVYMIGSLVIGFFIGEDIQVVYILEVAPKEKRGMAVSICKGVAVLGTMIVPLLRTTIMGNSDAKWHFVYLGVAIFGFIVALIALLTVRESTAFLESRINYLKMTDEERANAIKNNGKEKTAQGGLIKGLKFAFTHRQTRNLLIASFFMLFSSAITGTYQSVMNKAAGMGTADITFALYFYVLGNAIFVIIPGIISDIFGRKKSAVIFSALAILTYSAFFIGSLTKVYPSWLMGLLAGVFVGSFWGSNDTFSSIMIGESTPTNLRASVITIQSIISVSMTIGGLVASNIASLVGNDALLGVVYFCYSIPGMVIALLVLSFGVGETKGIDVSKVTGEEWNRQKKIKKAKE